jgi:hypothetical protein
MPETRQSVVLGEDPDPGRYTASAASAHGPDRGCEAASGQLHLEAMGCEDLRAPGCGPMLFEGGLRSRVDSVGELEDLLTRGLNGQRHATLAFDVGAGWISVGPSV